MEKLFTYTAQLCRTVQLSCALALLYSFCLLFISPIVGAAESTVILGAASGWSMVEERSQIEELSGVRPHRVLTLSSSWTGTENSGAAAAGSNGNNRVNDDILALYAAFRNFPAQESAVDLSISFDEGSPGRFTDSKGNYRVSVTNSVQSVTERWARYGRGAALFTGENRNNGAPVTISPTSTALFAPGRSVRDFSLEFWFFPNTMETGEQIISWNAADNQRIVCEAARNRLRWTFQGFFASPDNLRVPLRSEGGIEAIRQQRLSITLESRTVLVPRSWSHHLIRYNANTGLLEYLINGRLENSAYTTRSGREGGDVYTPLINRDGAFILGNRFSGMLDEFRIYNRAIAAPGHTALVQTDRTALHLPELEKFPRSGGRIETRTIDLGQPDSSVVRIEASGGLLSPASTGRMAVRNTYTGRGNFRFADASAVQFFIRAGNERFRMDQNPWQAIIPGQAIPASVQGRYVQIAAAFYPSGDSSTSPYLEELRIIYNKNEPPHPPSLVTARSLDGAVELSWRRSPDENVSGYLVYYGTSSGVYFGQGTQNSPIDAGNRTSLRIEGLRNGTLYFFAVVAYSGSGPNLNPSNIHKGHFSQEVNARPLRTN